MIKRYTLSIKLVSDALIGSGEGFGTVIDSDVVFDDTGLPYIPARRVKGILRESCKDLSCMFKLSDIKQLNMSDDKIFGEQGNTSPSSLIFLISNFYISEFSMNSEFLAYAIQKQYLSKNNIIDYFTNIRMNTAIDKDGMAKDGSLRTLRVLNKGIEFTGDVECDSDFENELGLICIYTRHIGSKRNRGFGEIRLKLVDASDNNLDITEIAIKKFEEYVNV